MAEISVNSIVHLTLYSFIVSGFTDVLFGNVLTQAVLDPILIFMALQKRQCPLFSCQIFLEYIYAFVPSLSNSLWGGGVPTPFLPMEKCVFPFFPMGKNGKKVYRKKGKSIHFPLFPYTFFPMGKNGKTHIFPWAKMGLDPPSLLTVIRKSMLSNGNPHSETVNKCSKISHSASFERTVG